MVLTCSAFLLMNWATSPLPKKVCIGFNILPMLTRIEPMTFVKTLSTLSQKPKPLMELNVGLSSMPTRDTTFLLDGG